MLDKLKEEYEESITNQLENFKSTVSKALGIANDNTGKSNAYLAAIAKANGYEIKDPVDLENIAKVINEKSTEIKDSPTDNPNNNSNDKPNANNGNSNSGEGIVGESAYTDVPYVDKIPNSPKDTTSSSAGKDSSASGGSASGGVGGGQTKKELEAKKKEVEAIFADSKNYAAGKKESADQYETKINRYLFEKNGKVLSSAGLKALRKALGTNNAGLYDAMVTLSKQVGNIKKVGGFKTGGIAKLVKSQGEDGLMLARNGEGFVSPEHVPAIQELLDTVPLMNNMFKPLVEAPKLPNLTPMNNMGNNVTFGDVHYVFDMPNVVDEQSFLNTMQSSQKIQKCMRSMTIDQLSGAGRLSCKSIK